METELVSFRVLEKDIEKTSVYSVELIFFEGVEVPSKFYLMLDKGMTHAQVARKLINLVGELLA
jgi:hypothetical protein